MEISRLLEYDLWATEQTLSQLDSLTQDQFLQEFAGPLSSVRQQAAHLITVPDRYRARILGEPVPDRAPDSFASAQEITDYFGGMASRMRSLCDQLSPPRLAEVSRHETRSGVFILTVEQTLLHVVNHGTFHRGQLAMLLKLHGVEPINTDLILWPALAD